MTPSKDWNSSSSPSVTFSSRSRATPIPAIDCNPSHAMKKNVLNFRSSMLKPLGLLTWASLLAALPCSHLRAELPAPDNILYGTLVVDGRPIFAVHTNFVLEATRTLGGAPIASYR